MRSVTLNGMHPGTMNGMHPVMIVGDDAHIVPKSHGTASVR